MTSLFYLLYLTHQRKILLVVLQIGKARDLSAPLCMYVWRNTLHIYDEEHGIVAGMYKILNDRKQ
jgi:hypothetical protein